jgi:hypothetical protein
MEGKLFPETILLNPWVQNPGLFFVKEIMDYALA